MIFIDIYPINAGGNLFDACGLVALAALRDAVFPKLDGNNKIDYSTKTKSKIPLTKLPISCTVWRVHNEFLVDPTLEEELASNARLSVVYTDDGNICAMQKGGDSPLTSEEISTILDIVEEKSKELRRHFK